jgi:hypothetical protein
MDYTGDQFGHIFFEIFKGIIFAFVVGAILIVVAILITNHYEMTDIDFEDLFELIGL